jgi:ubiquinone/menaquinone biosynthesis C-methylase UbiE
MARKMTEAEPFYDRSAPEEWKRFERHRTEFAVTLKVLEEYLPSPPCSVLDIGGGPGQYSIELARRGYSVTLLDLSSQSLRIAEEKAQEEGVSLESYIHANALDMSEVESAYYDAVLLMGPLYHLLSKEERVRSIREALRVLKVKGRLFVSFITRFAPFRHAAVAEPEWLLQNREYAKRLLETGVHDQAKKFAKAYFTHPEEVMPLMESCGVRTLNIVGCEGIVAGHEELINVLDGDDWEAWVELNYQLGQDQSMRGASDHLLYSGEKSS